MNRDNQSKNLYESVGHLAARWDGADRRILRHVFRLLAEGQPVSVSDIVKASGSSPAMVEAALEMGRATRDERGCVVELSGLMRSPTMHRVVIGEVALFSCCALLAHLITALLDRSVRVESIDPISRRVIGLTIAPEGVAAVEPAGALATFVVTEGSRMSGNVGEYFCRHVRHFASPETAEAFSAADDRRYPLGLGELHEAARHLHRVAWAV